MEKVRRYAPIALSMLLFSLAVWAISEEFKHYTFGDLLASFGAIPTVDKVVAIMLTALGYLSMSGYDWLGFRYIDRPLSLGIILRTSFISYAMGNTIGFTLFSGTAIRYRFYAPAGVGNLDLAKVITFTHFSFWLGMLALSGVSFLVDPLAIPDLLKLPFHTARPLGVIFLAIVFLYFVLTWVQKRPIRIAGEEFSLPSRRISIALILVTAIDWALAAGVLYCLLPDSYAVSYFGFFGLYIFAMIAGVISGVPGGIGVFEFIMLTLRPETVTQPDLLGSLIAYRGIYYFLPLIVAFIVLLGYEMGKKGRKS
jgi:glycosyltransferase 2 family protein